MEMGQTSGDARGRQEMGRNRPGQKSGVGVSPGKCSRVDGLASWRVGELAGWRRCANARGVSNAGWSV